MMLRSVRGAAALLCLGACGCSAMKEVPRDEYAALAERKDVRVETRSGERHDFERMVVRGDSLTGYERQDNEGSFQEFQTFALALEDVGKMSIRSVDWYRTGLVGGVAAAIVLAVVLTQANKGSSDGGGQGPCGDRPCP